MSGTILPRTVYTAGPMEALTVKEMKLWRNEADWHFQFHDIHHYDPTKRIPIRDQVEKLGDSNPEQVMNLYRRVFRQDIIDIKNSSVVLADCRRKEGQPRTGTDMEIMYAFTKGKPIIGFCNTEDVLHPFYESILTEKHYCLEDAIEATLEYFR